jgi:hypothetical protein
MPSKLLHGAKKWDGIPCIQEKEEIMDLPALHSRHRDRNGELSKKHGNTLVRTLRKIYGHHFAEGCSPEETLNEVLQKLGRAFSVEACARSRAPQALSADRSST